MSVARRFKSYFFRGLAVLLPTILTIWILVWGYGFIQDNISIHIKRGLVRLIILAGGSEEELSKFWIGGALSIAGFLLALIGVCIVGAVLASVVGRSLWRIIEKFIMNTPFLRQIYPYVKQITDFLLTQEEKKKLFSQVVAIEYPRKGIWAIGMVTGSGLKKIVDKVEKEFVTVFVPSSPTPFTGYVIMVPKEQTIEMDMTIEEALRFAVSGGVIAPEASKATAALPIDD
jgi:uncharacterized membrane protein